MSIPSRNDSRKDGMKEWPPLFPGMTFVDSPSLRSGVVGWILCESRLSSSSDDGNWIHNASSRYLVHEIVIAKVSVVKGGKFQPRICGSQNT